MVSVVPGGINFFMDGSERFIYLCFEDVHDGDKIFHFLPSVSDIPEGNKEFFLCRNPINSSLHLLG